MMKAIVKILILSAAWAYAVEGFSQYRYDYNWVFDKSLIDFNGDTVQINTFNTLGDIYISNTTISDYYGKFLGYTNGCFISDYMSNILENGDSLNYNDYIFYDDLCIDPGIGYTNGYQGMLSLFVEDSIFLIHEKINFNEEEFFTYVEELIYSLIKNEIDSLAVINKEDLIIDDNLLGAGHLSAIKHKDDYKWWIVKHDLHLNCYYSILFDGSSFTKERYDCLGLNNTPPSDGGGGAVFSPEGTLYARFNPEDALYLFDFDRATGELSNFEFIDIPKEGLAGGISFSPSGQYLYVSDRLHIRQYDVWAEDVAASEIIVAEYDGFIGNNFGQGTTFGQMQLAPDCRIYLNTGPALPYLHVIMKPDEQGMACDVRQHNITLPNPHIRSMPYFPNYRLGTDEPLCDSTKVIVLNGTTAPPLSAIDIGAEVHIFPNPASSYINVLLEENGMHTVRLFDVDGRLVMDHKIDGIEGIMDVRTVDSGLYTLWIRHTGSGKVATERVVVE